MKEQKVFLVAKDSVNEVAEELRFIIESGWKIVTVTNLTGALPLGYKLVVIVEKKKRRFWEK